MKKTILFLSFLLVSCALFAQNRAIKGKITDENGAPLQGVSVLLQGAKSGTQTNEGGNFNLKTTQEGTVNLVISYTGYKNLKVSTDGKEPLELKLEKDQNDLDNVVVIGYGTSKRKDLTGAISTMSSKDIMKVPVATATEALTGRLAGVQVAATEGSPDADIKIRVRGGASITGDNSPLLIVDGFPVTTISDIAPSDIESIDVLKDASSTAIYGSRGANGVIIVTTKSGKAGKFTVSYNVYAGYRKLAKKLNTITPLDYAKWQYEEALLSNNLSNYTKYLGNFQDIDLYGQVKGNDWQEQVFGRLGNTLNQNLSISGGTDKTRFTVSYNHIKDKAIMQLSGFQRDNLALKINNRPNTKITLDLAVRYARTSVDGGGTNEQNEVSSADSRLKYAMIYPSFPVGGLTDADETDPAFNLYHPLVALTDNDRKQTRANINLNGGLGWKLTNELQFKTEVGFEDVRTSDDRFYGKTTYYVNNVPAASYQGLPAIQLMKGTRQSIRNTNTLAYDFRKLLPRDHHLNLLLGQEYIATKQESLTSTVHGFPASFSFADATKLSAQGQANSVENFLNPDDRLFSYFGRANYDFSSKYLLGLTFRADGSSRFADGNRWGFFPSASAAWRISSEKFMEATHSWLDDLKLRASYGAAGNNNIPTGQMTQSLVVSSTTWVNGFNSFWAASKTMANPDLQWETTVTRNIGLDFTTKGKKINGTIDAYKNTTNNVLVQFPVPGTGYDNQYRNMGKTQNQGIELTLNWNAIDKKNFSLAVSANIGFNKNKVVSLGQMQSFGSESGWASSEVGTDYWVAAGAPLGQMYGYQLEGTGRYEVDDFTGYNAATGKWTLKDGVVDASPTVGPIRPGTLKLKNQNKEDNIVNNTDKVIIGNANPTHTGGFSLNSRIFQFDISAMFNWSYGNKIYNANKIEYTSTSKYFGRNMIDQMAEGKRWTNLLPDGTISNDPAQLKQMNANTTMWSPYMSRYIFTDWAVEDGSFLRLGTLSIGYNIPASLTRSLKIQNCRFYVTGYNIFCLTNYSGFDPEVSTRRRTNLTPGVDYSAYPRSRMVVMGLNLNF